MGTQTRLTKSTNIFGVPSLATAAAIDDSDKLSAFEAAHFRCRARMAELEAQFEAKASEIRAAFVREASEIVGRSEFRQRANVGPASEAHEDFRKSNNNDIPISQTFKTSRLAEFCSRPELVNQTGHAVEDWPLVVLKELFDNALDGCEEAGIAPEIAAAINTSGITVTDNGPGMAASAIVDITDYHVRVSSREAYVSPCRGAQGNALKTILAVPSALDSDHDGRVIIESRSVAYTINFIVDRIRQEPRIELTQEPSSVKIGTRVTVEWPDSASGILTGARSRILPFVWNYAWINRTWRCLWTCGRTRKSGRSIGAPRPQSRIGKSGGRPIRRRRIGMTPRGSLT